jgi:hypothetical protein
VAFVAADTIKAMTNMRIPAGNGYPVIFLTCAKLKALV